MFLNLASQMFLREGEMKLTNKLIRMKQQRIVLIAYMILVFIFAALAVSMVSLSGVNL